MDRVGTPASAVHDSQAVASGFSEIFECAGLTYHFRFQQQQATVRAFTATGALVLQHGFTAEELQLHSIRRYLPRPAPLSLMLAFLFQCLASSLLPPRPPPPQEP